MTTSTLDVFSLRDTVVDEYKQFATSFTTIHAEDIRAQVEAIYAQARYWPEPLIQINPSYKRIDRCRQPGDRGRTRPGLRRRSSRSNRREPLQPLQAPGAGHRARRAGRELRRHDGHGLGQVAVLLHPHRQRVSSRRSGASSQARTRAIVIYPMNALANSQLEELDKFVGNVPGTPPVTFARYTGQEDTEERKRIADNPPDILLTNFMMLELLMTRQDELDRRVIGNCAGLRFLVLDELHTYRGRQGADVALLVRRVRERLAPEHLQCIGTSATMASEGSLEDKSRVVARGGLEALLGRRSRESNVIVETLERITDPSANGGLGAARARRRPSTPGSPATVSDAELAHAPTRHLGGDAPRRLLVRGRPALGAGAPADGDRGRAALASGVRARRGRLPSRAARLAPRVQRARGANVPGREAPASGASSPSSCTSSSPAPATPTPPWSQPGQRTVTVDGQQFLPGASGEAALPRPLLPRLRPRVPPGPARRPRPDGRASSPADIDDAPDPRSDEDEAASDADEAPTTARCSASSRSHPTDADFTFADRDEDYPETWLEFDAAGNPRLKPNYRGRAPAGVQVAPDGRVGLGCQGLVPPGQVPLLPPLRRHAGRRGARPQPARVALGGGPKLGHHGARRQRAALDARRAVGPGAVHPQAPRLHRQPAGRRPPVRPLQRLPLRQPAARRLPRRA